VWSHGLRELRRLADVQTLDVPARRPGSWRRDGPDVWLTVADEGALALNEPVVTIVHGAAWTVEDTFWDHVPRAYAEGVIARTEAALRTASVAIAPSEYARRGVVATNLLAAEDVIVAPHGVDLLVFRPDRDGGPRIAERALGSGRPYVLFASVPTVAQKNLSSLRQAMALLADGGMPHALLVAGGPASGDSAETLAGVSAELADHPGRVAWLGAVDDATLASLMAGASACCLPSHFEAFGLTALEAMACGAPVVVATAARCPRSSATPASCASPPPRRSPRRSRGCSQIPSRRRVLVRRHDAGPRR
jgi:alpha-1,6-mannosyltransferase